MICQVCLCNGGPHPRRCRGTSPPSALRLSPAAAGEGEKRLSSLAAAGEGEKRLPSPVATGEGQGVRAFPMYIDTRDHFSAIVIWVTLPFASCAGSISIFSRRCACVIE